MTSTPQNEPSRAFPGGVVSEECDVAATAVGARLTVLDLTTGETLAVFERQCRPLAVCRRRVVAWETVGESRAALRVLMFDLARPAAPPLVSEPIVFPGWMDATELPAEALRTTMDADRATIEWRAQSRCVGGAPATPEMQDRLARAARGVATVDLHTGAAKVADEVAEYQEPTMPASRDACVVGDTVYSLVVGDVITLEARALETGALLWSRNFEPVRNPKSPRPPPPGAALGP